MAKAKNDETAEPTDMVDEQPPEVEKDQPEDAATPVLTKTRDVNGPEDWEAATEVEVPPCQIPRVRILTDGDGPLYDENGDARIEREFMRFRMWQVSSKDSRKIERDIPDVPKTLGCGLRPIRDLKKNKLAFKEGSAEMLQEDAEPGDAEYQKWVEQQIEVVRDRNILCLEKALRWQGGIPGATTKAKSEWLDARAEGEVQTLIEWMQMHCLNYGARAVFMSTLGLQ